MKDKKYLNFKDHYHYTGKYRGAVHGICNLKYSVPKKICIAFHNGANYGYHCIIKELAEEFKKQLTCLRENTEKCTTFTVPIQKEDTRINKNGEEVLKNISYMLQIIDRARFTTSSLSNLVNNVSEEIHKLNVNTDTMTKNMNLAELHTNYVTVFLNTQILKMI